MVETFDDTLLKGILPKNDVNLILNFIFGGNAVFTIKNNETGNRFTFKVVTMKEKKGDRNAPYFVRVLTGSDIYSFIGTCFFKDGVWSYKHSENKSKVGKDAQSVQVFSYVLKHLQMKDLPSQVDVWHEGRCGRCGRQLTVPESIEHGFGPECFQMINKLRHDKE
jgi:hypothetical protein